MNHRIVELAEQAGLKVESWMTNPPKPFQILGSTEQFEKFAESLIRECADLYDKSADNWFGPTTKDILKQYSIQLKKHFGVTE